MKKKKLFIIVGAVLALSLVLYFLVGRDGEAKREVELTSGGANWTPEQNIALQQGLVNAVGKYMEAVSYTNAVFFTDIEETEYEEWKAKLEKAISSWEELEQMQADMDVVFDDLGIPESSQTSQAPVFEEKHSFFAEPAWAASEIPELGAVTAVFDSAEKGQKIRTIMEVFDWDKDKAFYHLKREQGLLQAEAWDKAGDTYKRWETAARAVKNTSKVTVYVGANIITAGGASATVGAFQATTMVVGGVSLALEVGEDVNIAIGNNENAAALRGAQETIKPITEIVSIVSLQDMSDPGNLFYIADKSGELFQVAKEGYLYIVRNDAGKVLLSTDRPENIKLAEDEPEKESEEVKKAGLPEGNYKIEGEKVEVEKKEEPEEKSEKELEAEVDISDILNLAVTMSKLKAAQKPTLRAESTSVETGDTVTLTVKIPESIPGPFEAEYVDIGGFGAGVVFPSNTDSRIFTGTFVSSNPGTFAVRVRITDSEGRVYTAGTAISVEAREAQEGVGLQEGMGTDFTCADLESFPSTLEGCHVNEVCPNSKNPCAKADEEFIEKVKEITAGYRDLDPYECGELISIDACQPKDPELCQKAWEGKDMSEKISLEDLPEIYREACSAKDPLMCQAQEDSRGDKYERCLNFLSADGPSMKVSQLVRELYNCYSEVFQKKNEGCGDKLSDAWNREKSKVVGNIKDTRAEGEEILAQKRPVWDQIYELELQIDELDPEEDADRIRALESQIVSLEGEIERLEREYRAIDLQISELTEERDQVYGSYNSCVNYCANSIWDPESEAIGRFAGNINDLYDYRTLMELIE